MIDAVVVTWNAARQACACVEHTREPELVASIVVVDNGSTDATADAVRAAHPDVTVIALEQGVGLARALNLGARLGRAPYVLYLNDDVCAEDGAIRSLLEALRARPDAVAAGGRLVDADGSTQDRYRPRGFPSPATVVASLLGLARLWPRNPWTGAHLRHPLGDGEMVEVDQPAGACLLVRRSAADRIAGWDERYWFWYEDVDFSRRLAALGASLYVPAATFRHVGGATARRLRAADGHARYYHGALVYAGTWFSRRGRGAVALATLAVSLGRAALRVPADRREARVYLRSARSALALLCGRSITRA